MNRKRFLIFIFLFLNLILLFPMKAKFYSPNNRNYLYIIKLADMNYEFVVYNSIIRKDVLVYKGFLRYEIDDSIIVWHSDNLVEIKVKTGSPGFYSIFYSIDENKISEPIYFILAVDAYYKIALSAGDEVFILSIFNKNKKYYIIREYNHSAIKWLIFDKFITKFNENHNLIIKYINRNGNWITEIIKNEDILLKLDMKK